MKTSTKHAGLIVKSSVKGGLVKIGNHNRQVLAGLAVKSSVKCGLVKIGNHNRQVLAS